MKNKINKLKTTVIIEFIVSELNFYRTSQKCVNEFIIATVWLIGNPTL